MSEEDVRACLHFNGNTLICNPSSPVFHSTNGVCELAMLKNNTEVKIHNICRYNSVPVANYVIKINLQDRYFISVKDSVKIVNSCGDGRVERTKITQNGILTVEPDCVISTDDVQIRSHGHKYSNE